MSKPLQFFLDPSGVSTVSLGEDKRSLTCDCPAFKKKESCKHVEWVGDRILKTTGLYPVQISKRAPDDEMKAAFSGDNDAYRDFLLKYGKVEVLADA